MRYIAVKVLFVAFFIPIVLMSLFSLRAVVETELWSAGGIV